MGIKYALHPGYTLDGHRVSATQLAGLYGVPWNQCVVVDREREDYDEKRSLANKEGLRDLYIDHSGEYTLERELNGIERLFLNAMRTKGGLQ